MMTRRVAITGGLGGIALASALSETHGQGADGDFEGKFVIIQQKSEPDHGVYLEAVRVKKLGDRNFLAGVGIKVDHPLFKPLVGVTQWVPVDEIKWIGVYPTLEAIISGIPELPKQS